MDTVKGSRDTEKEDTTFYNAGFSALIVTPAFSEGQATWPGRRIARDLLSKNAAYQRRIEHPLETMGSETRPAWREGKEDIFPRLPNTLR